MTVMAIRPTSPPSSPARDTSFPRDHRATLPADPRAVAEARRQVRAAIRYWRLPVDGDVAVLLVSELATNAITHDGRVPEGRSLEGRTASRLDTITLTIQCRDGRLRVDVHDTSPEPPVLSGSAPVSAEGGRGLFLVDSLAASWGSYRTDTGKAVFFTL
jgi:anti-sigma regulatory factor (Ser/Thr protein kinase)